MAGQALGIVLEQDGIEISQELTLICHVRNYCDVPIGWIIDTESQTKRTFIGLDQAQAVLEELGRNTLGENEFTDKPNQKSKRIHMVFSDDPDPEANAPSKNTGDSKKISSSVPELMNMIEAKVKFSKNKYYPKHHIKISEFRVGMKK